MVSTRVQASGCSFKLFKTSPACFCFLKFFDRDLKKKNKDIIITTPISYIASSSIAKFLGYEIIYIDININNYLLDLDKLDIFLKNINKKIKARIAGVIFVELFGNTGDLSKFVKKMKYGL
jgi:dTDP-4-amino-4,6-dideoxygalactose transaminase